jgi:hypothetical protein
MKQKNTDWVNDWKRKAFDIKEYLKNYEGSSWFERVSGGHLVEPTVERLLAKGDFKYKSVIEYVLRTGKKYTKKIDLPAPLKYRKIGKCYWNSFQVAKKYGYKYVEGFATPIKEEIPFGGVVAHAWNLDEQGNVIDTTWNPKRVKFDVPVYLGVEMPLDFVKGHIRNQGWLSVLQNPNNVGDIYKG